eukprot:scaffold29816_cov94-Skeletonema_dohrnii-CCMP3373.AAC.1
MANYNGSLEAVDCDIHSNIIGHYKQLIFIFTALDTIWCYSSSGGHPKLGGSKTNIATWKRWVSGLFMQQSSNECLQMERLLPNPFPLQSIHRSSSSTKIQLRLPGKGAATALFMIGLAFIGGATNGGGPSNKEISILGQPAMYIPPTCYKEMRYRAAEPMGDCGVMFPAFNR